MFIPATVEDNTHLLESSPLYLKNLANMPEDVRRAYRYGDWDAIGGNYFKEFGKQHIVKPFPIPKHWKLYRSFDYGLDMFYCAWWAVDEDGRCWCIRTFEKKDLIVSDAAKECLDHTLPGENVTATYAPPDMWSRLKDSGKTMAETFNKNGLPIIKSENNRVQGHMLMKEALAPATVNDPFVKKHFGKDKLPMLMFFNNCGSVLSDIRDIQADDKDPNDCAKQPHEITHSVDCCRYFIVSRIISTEAEVIEEDIDEDLHEVGYEEFMTGGEIPDAYIAY